MKYILGRMRKLTWRKNLKRVSYMYITEYNIDFYLLKIYLFVGVNEENVLVPISVR